MWSRLFAQLPPRPALSRVAFWVTVVLLVRALLLATYLVLGDIQGGMRGTIALRLVNEFSGVLTALPFLALVAWGAAKWPLTREHWGAHLLPLSVLFVVFSVGHTLAMETSRALVYPLIGRTREIGAEFLTLAIWHEMPNDLFNFATFVGAIVLWQSWWVASERERRNSDLRRSLVEAQLSALRLQLQPHFLFNALNTISSTMYEDPRRADAMLGELAELLRASLRIHQRDEVPLREEVGIAERYIRLQHERFGDRLSVTFDVEESALGVRVPVFVLQPLIENAVRYGRVEREGRGAIRVTARCVGDQLLVDVWDDGGGQVHTVSGTGLGLRSIAERLRLLHGDEAHFDAGPADGGWRARLAVPMRESS